MRKRKLLLSSLMILSLFAISSCGFFEPDANPDVPGGDVNPDIPGGGDTDPDIPGGGDTKPDIPGGGDTKPDIPGGGDTEPDIPGGGDTDPDIPGGGDTDPDIPGGDIKPDKPVDPEGGQVMPFREFKTNVESSKPTKVQTYVFYSVPKYDITLHYVSTLSIEYNQIIEAQYTYSYEKLNPIGSDEFISTYNGTMYARGDMYGELNKNQIDWNIGIEGSISLLGIRFEEGLFDAPLGEIKDGKFVGKISNKDNVTQFLQSDYGINALDVEMGLDLFNAKEPLGYSIFNYVDKEGANVSIHTTYSYNAIDVVIPE